MAHRSITDPEGFWEDAIARAFEKAAKRREQGKPITEEKPQEEGEKNSEEEPE